MRELEKEIQKDLADGIDSIGKKMTLCQVYAKQNASRSNVKKTTAVQRDRKSTRLNSSHIQKSRMPSSA